MGIKGEKLSQDSLLSAQLLVEKLDSIDNITIKRLFGGYGVFYEGKMFGINSKGQSYLKVDDSNKVDFEEKGAHQHSKMPYFSIPEEVLSNPERLTDWAYKLIEISK